MDKVLILASVASMIDQFNKTNIDILKQLGYEVHVAANFLQGSTSSKQRVDQFIEELQQQRIPCHHVDLSRKTINITANIRACGQILNLLKETRYRFIHCHSPIGGFCGRIAAHVTGTPAIYTAHGFHFYDGAPLLNWLLYYPVERLLAKHTDALVTINHEDFERSRTFGAKNVFYVPGIGVETYKLGGQSSYRDETRRLLGLNNDTLVLLSIGELIENKNHATALRAVARLPRDNVVYLVCGGGKLESRLRILARSLGLENTVRFLGFRNDVPRLCAAADVFLFPSIREGLSVALMEAMAAGLPVVCSRIRGNIDLIEEGKGGYLVPPNEFGSYAERLERLLGDANLRRKMSSHNIDRARQHDVAIVKTAMRKIYEQIGSGSAKTEP